MLFFLFFSSSLEPIKPGLQQLKEICPDASDLENYKVLWMPPMEMLMMLLEDY